MDRSRKNVPEAVQAIVAQALGQRLAYDDAAFAEACRIRGMNGNSGMPADVVRFLQRFADHDAAHSGPDQQTKPTQPLRSKTGVYATPYRWTDPNDLPKREWIYGRSLIRRFVTVTVAPGGVGKSSLSIVEALSLVTGRTLLNKYVEKPSRVWLWNLEDPLDELQRRIQAVCEHYDISAADMADRFFVDSGRDHPLCTAVSGKNRTIIQRPVIDAMIEEIRARQIDVFVVDPFISSHAVSENDNPAMDAVAKEWGKVAEATNCAIHLVHHTRKLGSDAEVTAESSRGGKALTDAAREVRAINRMSAEEGVKFGITNHRSFFRMYSDKANMAPPAEISDWYEIKNVMLPNGDHVGVVTSWDPPGAFDDVTIAHLSTVQKRIHDGEWREDIRSPNWAGYVVAEVLGLDADDPTAKQRIKTLLKTWIENKALRVDFITDEKRRERRVVRVGEWAE